MINFKKQMMLNFKNYRFWVCLPVTIIGLVLLLTNMTLNKSALYLIKFIEVFFGFIMCVVEVVAKIIFIKIIMVIHHRH